MAQESSPFRYRTIFEIAAISLVIYFLLGTPGLSSTSAPNSQLQSHSRPSSSQIRDEDVPLAKAAVESLVTPDPNPQCPAHAFKNVHIFSTAPLVVYIDGFLSDDEADHLVDISFVPLSRTTFSQSVLTTGFKCY